MRIRLVERRDAPEVARLATQLGYASTTEQVERRLDVLATKTDTALYIAARDTGTLAGWVSVQGRHQVESEPDAIIEGLVVDASARRAGVGHALMAEVERWARERSYGSVRLRSNTIRTEALAFYESIGYRVIKTQNAFLKTLV